MKNRIALVLFTLLVTACQNNKIGFVDNGKVINAYQAKVDIEKAFKLKEEAFKKNIDSVSLAFQLEAKDFQAKASRMAPKKAQAAYDKLMEKQQLLQQQTQLQQENIQKEFQEKIDSAISKMQRFVKDYGINNGYTFILGKNEAGSVLYGKEALDITEQVIKELNEAHNKEKE